MASKLKGKASLGLSDEKMEALVFSLSEKGKDLDEMMSEFLDSLYRKHVPIVIRRFIDRNEKPEEEMKEKEPSSEEIEFKSEPDFDLN